MPIQRRLKRPLRTDVIQTPVLHGSNQVIVYGKDQIFPFFPYIQKYIVYNLLSNLFILQIINRNGIQIGIIGLIKFGKSLFRTFIDQLDDRFIN